MKGFWKKIFSGGGWALFTMFVWEMVEEVLENAIAYVISSAFAMFITKAISTFAVITATQGIKSLLKKFLLPFIKQFTYKEGDDKMKFFKKIWEFLKANKFSLLGTASAVTATLSGTGVIAVDSLPALMIGSFNITPVIYYLALGVLSIVGISKKGWETINEYLTRVDEEKTAKAEEALVKEAQKEIVATEKAKKKALKEAQKELEAEEKAKAEEEHKAQVAEMKAKLVAEASETTVSE